MNYAEMEQSQHPGELQYLRSRKKKKTARKGFREQKSQVAEELALRMASVKQRATGTRLDQVPKQRCY